MKKLLFLFSLITLVLTACQEKSTPENSLLPVKLGFGISTKATDTAFETGDDAGVFMDGLYTNVKYAYTTSWASQTEMFWPDNTTPHNFYVYSPFMENTALGEIKFQTNADQSTLAKYKASDFIWGCKKNVTPTAETVVINSSHILTKVIVKVALGDGFTEEEKNAATISVQLLNLKTEASINLTDGTVSASGTVQTVKPYKNGNEWQAIIVPQSLANNTQLVVVDVNGVTYSLLSSMTFASGKKQTLTVNVARTDSGITIGLGDWETDDTDYGGSAS